MTVAKLRFYRVPTKVSWSASGTISQELSPIPHSIAGLLIKCNTNITTTTPTNYNDYWDRMIATLSLTGQVLGQNKTFFSFTNMRLPYHLMRRELGRYCPRRPTAVAVSITSGLYQFATLLHFGCNPFKPNGDFNWMDMSAGIPPTQKGQLTLGGTWGAAACFGSANVTLNSGALEIYAYGVQSEPGDAIADYTPQAFPVWSMTSPTPTATSSTLGTPYSVTSGNHLRTIAIMLTRGDGYPRDNQTLRDSRLYNQLENREIISFGGAGNAGDASGGDYAIGEQFSQLGVAVPTDNSATLGVPSVAMAQGSDLGLVFFRLVDYSNRVHPLYGADLRRINTGDLRLDWGVNNATTIALDLLYQRYELNVEHPANAGVV